MSSSFFILQYIFVLFAYYDETVKENCVCWGDRCLSLLSVYMRRKLPVLCLRGSKIISFDNLKKSFHVYEQCFLNIGLYAHEDIYLFFLIYFTDQQTLLQFHNCQKYQDKRNTYQIFQVILSKTYKK